MSTNPYRDLTVGLASKLAEGRNYQLGGFPFPTHPEPAAVAPKVMIFSPHPDDEVIIGGAALRLMRQHGWRAINVAVTLGSRLDRQQGRLQELKKCCRYIGFELLLPKEGSLSGIHLKNRTSNPENWGEAVAKIASVLLQHRPSAILFPHESDRNSTHIGTHFLLRDALQRLGDDFSCAVLETEFWGAMDTPNLMVEISPEDLGDMLTALSFHEGEVKRNPYHLRTASWMIDNVRRGGELVGAQGAAAPDFPYATLYRLRRWEKGRLHPVLSSGAFVDNQTSLAELVLKSSLPA